jgi:hypothetical protein
MASAAVLGGQWGKYGIISESEYVLKPSTVAEK